MENQGPKTKKLVSRRNLIKAGLCVSALGGSYSYCWEPYQVEYNHFTLDIQGLPEEFQGTKLVHISDLHYDSGSIAEWLPEVVDNINALDPDIIAITGDFVSFSPSLAKTDLMNTLKRLAARFGVFAVPGNHDHWTDVKAIRRMMEESNIIDVSNQAIALTQGSAQLQICGVDDILTDHHNLKQVTQKAEQAICSILLAHEPDYADVSARSGFFNLQLSGHSHGGQVRLPIVGAPLLPPLGQKYPYGLYQIENLTLFTSKGLGCVPPEVRFNCRPEVAILTLV